MTPLVKQTITIDRLAEDMELELAELFPKQSDLRLQAVKLLMFLGESGPKKQMSSRRSWVSRITR